jgi:hypothetical protein
MPDSPLPIYIQHRRQWMALPICGREDWLYVDDPEELPANYVVLGRVPLSPPKLWQRLRAAFNRRALILEMP